MAVNELVREKILDFERRGIPDVFERDLSLGDIQPPARGNLVNVVVGARRCGKTCRLYQEMHRIVAAGYSQSSILYFNFEDERLKPYSVELLSDVVDTFYAMHPETQQSGAFFFFDEIQEVPQWGTFLRRLVDTADVTVYVTGSSSKMLSSDIATEFRGRAFSRELFPLSFSEFVRFRGGNLPKDDGYSTEDQAVLRHTCAEYLERGGFIVPLKMSATEGLLLLQEYAQRTVAMDVVERYGVRNQRVASLFLSRCLASSARELSISKVYGEFRSRQISVSRETLGNLLSYYEDAYVLFSVGEFSRAIADNPRSVSKVYAVDPGMFTAFSSAISIDLGQRLETAVFNKLRRDVTLVRKESISKLLLREGTSKHEIDFVVGDALTMEPFQLVQVCVSLQNESTRKREFAALETAMRRFGLAEGTIVTMDEEYDVPVEGVARNNSSSEGSAEDGIEASAMESAEVSIEESAEASVEEGAKAGTENNAGVIHVVPVWKWLLD